MLQLAKRELKYGFCGKLLAVRLTEGFPHRFPAAFVLVLLKSQNSREIGMEFVAHLALCVTVEKFLLLSFAASQYGFYRNE